MSGMGGRERAGVNCVTGMGGLITGLVRCTYRPFLAEANRIFWDLNGVAVVVKV